MKHPVSRLFFVLSLLLFSCSRDTEELVAGRWKIEDVTVPIPDNVPESDREYYADQIKQKNVDLLSSGFYVFNKGGQGFFELNGTSMEGKWRLSEDKKKIFFKEKNDVAETTFDIKEISETDLLMEINENGQTIRIVMKKVNIKA